MRWANNYKPQAYLKQEDGFSFVEIMVALAILSIAITALIGLITSSTMLSARAADKSRVTDAMAQLADQLRALPFDQAGVQKTYVSSDGVMMTLDVKTSTTNGANVKVITISGISNELTPNTKQSLQVVIRNPTLGSTSGGGDTTTGAPPTINYLMVKRDTTILSSGGLLYGGSSVWFSATCANPDATLTSLQLSCNGEPIGQTVLDPLSGSSYFVNWSSASKDLSGNRLYKDGIGTITLEVKDSMGGYAKKDFPVVIDNDPVVSTFSNTAISVFTSSGITLAWNPITDPAAGKDTAIRYKVVLDVYKKNGTFVAEYSNIITAATPATLPPTTTNFPVTYSNSQRYTVKIYAMCPDGCVHSPNISTSYLTKTF